MLSIFPSVAKLQEAFDKTRAELMATQEELTKLRKQHCSTVQSASEEIRQWRTKHQMELDENVFLRKQVTDLALKLKTAEGKLAGARGRAMRKEKARLKFGTQSI